MKNIRVTPLHKDAFCRSCQKLIMEQLAREMSKFNFIFCCYIKMENSWGIFNTSKKAACNIKWQSVYYSWHSNMQQLSDCHILNYITHSSEHSFTTALPPPPPQQQQRARALRSSIYYRTISCSSAAKEAKKVAMLGKWRFSNLTNRLYIRTRLISRSH